MNFSALFSERSGDQYEATDYQILPVVVGHTPWCTSKTTTEGIPAPCQRWHVPDVHRLPQTSFG